MAIQKTLSELSLDAYTCDPCRVELARAGNCPKCNAALQVAKRPLFPSVTTAPDDSSISMRLNPRRAVRLSAIEAALQRNAVTIDISKVPLPGRTSLIARGATADQLAAAEKAIRDARLFDEVTATYDAPSGELRFAVLSKATPPPTRMQAAKALEALRIQVADVVYGRVREAGG